MMPAMDPIDPKRTAVLCMDYQKDILPFATDDAPALLGRADAVLAAARAAGAQVIYVVVGFRPGYPEVSPHNAWFSQITGTGRFATTDPAGEVVAEVAPKDGDLVTVKHRVSAFAGSDLEMILRAKGVDTLVLFGISTSGVVLSTVRQAADMDFRLVVVSDCCADRDPEVHRVLTEKVLARQATVITADAATAALTP